MAFNASSLRSLNFTQTLLLDTAGGACCEGLYPPGVLGAHDAWIAPPNPVQAFAASLAALSKRVLMMDGIHLIAVSADEAFQQWPLSYLSAGCGSVSEFFASEDYVALHGCGALVVIAADTLGSGATPVTTIQTDGFTFCNGRAQVAFSEDTILYCLLLTTDY